MKLSPKDFYQMIKQAGSDWSADKAPRLGAALAYYTIFSLAPLLIIAIAIAGFVFGREAASGQIFSQIQGLVGEQGAKFIESMLTAANKPHQGMVATTMAIVTLIFGATGLFIQLQDALNTVWDVKQKPGQGIKSFIVNRLLSFAMVLSIGFLLLVSLVLSAALAAFAKFTSGLMPGMVVIGDIINFVVSFGVITLLFATIFKLLPDVKIAWKDVWFGAAFTALLFTIGKYGLGLYLGKRAVSSSYGAAGSLVVILLWVYWSAQILFFGAEITQVHANKYGVKVTPKEHAVMITHEEEKEIHGGVAVPVPKGKSSPAAAGARTRPLTNPKPLLGSAFSALLLVALAFIPTQKSRLVKKLKL